MWDIFFFQILWPSQNVLTLIKVINLPKKKQIKLIFNLIKMGFDLILIDVDSVHQG